MSSLSADIPAPSFSQHNLPMVPFAPDAPTQTHAHQAKLLGLLSAPYPGPWQPHLQNDSVLPNSSSGITLSVSLQDNSSETVQKVEGRVCRGRLDRDVAPPGQGRAFCCNFFLSMVKTLSADFSQSHAGQEIANTALTHSSHLNLLTFCNKDQVNFVK